MVVAINAGDEAATVPLPLEVGPTSAVGTIVLATARARTERAAIVGVGATVAIELPPRAGVVIRVS